MKRFLTVEISVAIGLIFSIAFSVLSFGSDCSNIRKNVVRLHVLANSNSDIDQEVKLAVRDALLSSGTELFSGKVKPDEAQYVIEKRKSELTETANKTLKENGFDYKAEVYFVNEYFTTRSYENFTLPAGEYSAVKVILGKGEGKNWWCVMFPPLCLPAAVKTEDVDIYFGDKGTDIIKNYNKYEMKFKIIEVFEGIRSRIKNKI